MAIIRLGDLAPYAPRRTIWQRLVIAMFSAPERIWSVRDLHDAVFDADPDGGPLGNSIVRAVYVRRHDLPPGWRLETVGQRGYQLARNGEEAMPVAAGSTGPGSGPGSGPGQAPGRPPETIPDLAASRHLANRLRQAAAYARSALAGLEVDVALNVHHLIALAEHAAGEIAAGGCPGLDPATPAPGALLVAERREAGFRLPTSLVIDVGGELAEYRLERVRG